MILSHPSSHDHNATKTHDPNWWKDAVDTAAKIFRLVKDNYSLGDLGDTLPKVQEITEHLINTLQLLPTTSQYTHIPTGNRTSDLQHVTDQVKEVSEHLRTQETTLQEIQDTLSKPNTVTPSFAQVTAWDTRRPIPRHPPKPPLRYVVSFKGNPPPQSERLTSERAMRKINDGFRSMNLAPNLLALGVTCKPNGNYIISFSPSSSTSDADNAKHVLTETLAPNHPTASTFRDVPWTRVIVHSISRKDDNFVDRTEEDIDNALRLNPILQGVQITQKARWLLPPERLLNKRSSSISFTFIDKPNSIVNSLLTEPFHMFGSQVHVEPWQNIPKFAQCKRCWKVTHNTQNCSAVNPRCRRCGKTGTEDDHSKHCAECRRLPPSDLPCSHVMCSNCHAHDHCADDPNCPKIKMAQPKMARNHRTNTQPTNSQPSRSQ